MSWEYACLKPCTKFFMSFRPILKKCLKYVLYSLENLLISRKFDSFSIAGKLVICWRHGCLRTVGLSELRIRLADTMLQADTVSQIFNLNLSHNKLFLFRRCSGSLSWGDVGWILWKLCQFHSKIFLL